MSTWHINKHLLWLRCQTVARQQGTAVSLVQWMLLSWAESEGFLVITVWKMRIIWHCMHSMEVNRLLTSNPNLFEYSNSSQILMWTLNSESTVSTRNTIPEKIMGYFEDAHTVDNRPLSKLCGLGLRLGEGIPTHGRPREPTRVWVT